MRETVLVLVCKRPAPGHGKQRLAGVLGDPAAERIANLLLACALEDCESWPGPVVIAPSRPGDRAWASTLLSKAMVIPQSGGNLGERLNVLDRVLRGRGFSRIVYMGSDAPGLTPPDFFLIREALDHHDIALAPARDGGVVLMGSRRPWPDLGRLPWSAAGLGERLSDLCRAEGLTAVLLGTGFDVDHPEDLLTVLSALEEDLRPARRAFRSLAGRLLSTAPAGLWRERGSGYGAGKGDGSS